MTDRVPVYYYITNTLPAVMLSILGMTYYVYIPKVYSDEFGLDLTSLGLIILLSRVWDAVIDPIIGTLSDNTHSAWGRRKPWMSGGSIFLCFTFYFLLNPFDLLSSTQLAIWFGIGSFLFFIFWTSVTVPYEALGVELSFDYDERTRLLGLREGGILIGTFLASLIPFLVTSSYGDSVSLAHILSFLAVWYCFFLMISSGLAVTTLHSKPSLVYSSQQQSYSINWRVLYNNHAFRLLLIGFALTSFGQYLSASLILFFTEHVLGSTNGSQFLALYLGITFLSIPCWLHLTNFVEKRLVWIVSMISTVIPFVFVLFLGKGDGNWYGLFISVSALFSGGMLSLPASMQADVIDLDEYETGLRREGLFIGVWALFRKLSAAVGTGLAFPILDIFGYTSVGDQPESAVMTLSILYAGVPCLCYLAACGLIWYYPVTRDYHRLIREKIDSRNLEMKAAAV